MKKNSLTLISILVVLFGLGHFLCGTFIGWIDTGSVKIVIARGHNQEMFSNFKFSAWRSPTEKIRPFICGDKSYKEFEIVRYRQGSWPNWLIRRSYYEAEYLKPDGSKEIGPAFGPLAYSSPNYYVSVVAIGLILLIASLIIKSNKGIHLDAATQRERCPAFGDSNAKAQN